MQTKHRRTVFFISDSTGITTEDLGHSLILQFQSIEFDQISIPYIDTIDKAKAALAEINKATKKNRHKSLVFSSLVNPDIRKVVAKCNGVFMDIFNIFVPPLKKELKTKPTLDVGKTHGMPSNLKTYDSRIDSVHFAIDADDGNNTKNYEKADIILVGVSRCGKTPTCIYMALQFGIYAANYPITPEDMLANKLPKILEPYHDKLFGLMISPQRLHEIRQIRRPESSYASIKQCKLELNQTEEMFKKEKISYLNSTSFSIEEIATKIIKRAGIKRSTL